ncbi:MAG: hypothetical protein M0R66_01190 [Candidatus Omnitrophica bacterium]|nr:hypothetical protein [Candidatus Omnitrophota bacterium]
MNENKRLVFYSHTARKLQGTVGDKIEAFLSGEPDAGLVEQFPGLSERQGCVAYSQETKNHYLLPLTGYNTRTYTIRRNRDYKFECNCQGWQESKETWEAFCKELELIKPHLHPGAFLHLKFRLIEITRRTHPPMCSHVASVIEHYARRHRKQKLKNFEDAMNAGMQFSIEGW